MHRDCGEVRGGGAVLSTLSASDLAGPSVATPEEAGPELWGKQVWIVLWKRRFRCRPCRYVFTEDDPVCGSRKRTTRRLRGEIALLELVMEEREFCETVANRQPRTLKLGQAQTQLSKGGFRAPLPDSVDFVEERVDCLEHFAVRLIHHGVVCDPVVGEQFEPSNRPTEPGDRLPPLPTSIQCFKLLSN